MKKDSEILYYKKPAKKWTSALPLGNGKIGAMIYGNPQRELISLNHDELWTGFPRNYCNMCSYDAFVKARELALDGSLREAQKLLESEFEGLNSDAYLPFGDINIKCHRGSVKNYERSLDLSTAIHFVRYEKDGAVYTRESFISHPDNALVMYFGSDKPNSVSLELEISSKLKSSTSQDGNCLILDGICPSYGERNKEFLDKDYPLYPKEDQFKGMQFRGAVKIRTDGVMACMDNKLTVANANYAVVFFTCETSFNGYDKHPYLQGKEYKEKCISTLEAAANKPYDELKQSHIEDYTSFYNRVSLDLGTMLKSGVPTDKRLSDFQGSGDDPGLYALLFNYGRYLTIAGSREGTQAMNLQGIWNDSVNPPWNSNYTVNINTEMNYYPTLVTDLAEMHLPLIDMIKDMSVAGEQTAKELYHARGFTAHHNVDIWRLTTPVQGDSQWSFWCLSSGWLCRHLFDHYEYTLDKGFLKNTAFPIMKKAAEFYLDVLVPDNEGYLILAPSTSPENTFKTEGGSCAVSQTSTMSMSIIKELFANCIKAAAILGSKDSVIQEIKEKYEKLLPFKIGAKGDLMEWYNDETSCEPHHRHVSHLFGLYPGNMINPRETPDLARAARRTLELRGDNGTGWSLGWKINFWARLRDGNHALKLLDMQLRPVDNKFAINYSNGGGTYPNMFDAHPPFQIDGNFGAVSGIAEMLLQSTENEIFLLPALPDPWVEGSVKGLKAKGDIKVDISWSDGELSEFKLTGNVEGKKIYYNDKEVTI